MELGEAVQTAIERGLPLLLSTEAAGAAQGHRPRRAHEGPPRAADDHDRRRRRRATTRRVVAEQAIAELRALKHAGARVTLDAGARQLVRMTLARPLADDPILLGRQRELAALKVVGSGVDASPGRHRQDDHHRPRARAPRGHHAAASARMVVAEGRLLGQWRDELAARRARPRAAAAGAERRACSIVDDHGRSPGSCAPSTARSATAPGVVLVANGMLDRHPGELADDRAGTCWSPTRRCATPTPPPTPTRRSRSSGFGVVADCWLLTATPRGKSAEHLDVLVGLAVGDEAMIRERLNTREAGDLIDEIHAHRLRVNYGPHLVRVTRQDMQAWMPDVRPAAAARPRARRRRWPSCWTRSAAAAARPTGGCSSCCASSRRSTPAARCYKQALAELARVQGVVLGNVGVYLDASVDPETLLHSKAALAQALARQGLVGEAMRGGGDGLPLLRGITAQTIAGVAGEEQVIVFAERVRCLRQLAAHAARTPRRRGARRRRLAHRAPSSRRSSSASAPASSRSCA